MMDEADNPPTLPPVVAAEAIGYKDDIRRLSDIVGNIRQASKRAAGLDHPESESLLRPEHLATGGHRHSSPLGSISVRPLTIPYGPNDVRSATEKRLRHDQADSINELRTRTEPYLARLADMRAADIASLVTEVASLEGFAEVTKEASVSERLASARRTALQMRAGRNRVLDVIGGSSDPATDDSSPDPSETPELRLVASGMLDLSYMLDEQAESIDAGKSATRVYLGEAGLTRPGLSGLEGCDHEVYKLFNIILFGDESTTCINECLPPTSTVDTDRLEDKLQVAVMNYLSDRENS